MTPRKKKMVIAGAVLGMTVVSGVVGLQSANAVTSECPKERIDGNSYGVSCIHGTYQAVARCANGEWVNGPKVTAPTMSVANCAAIGSTYDSATGQGHALFYSE